MATLVFSAVGAAVGTGFGGTVLGLSGAVIGRAVGATIGRSIDQRILGGGAEAVEVGRIDRLRLSGASEGAPVARIWGRMRVAGQIIWATEFREHVSRRGGGKGAPQPRVTEYSYSVSLAIALCQGEILKVGRIWADGNEVSPEDLNLRVYKGNETQLPDPRIEATEGTGKTPAFRGIAYVVIEDLDISAFGNRVPQFTFEVMRAAQGDGVDDKSSLAKLINGVALIPGTGEYSLATSQVTLPYQPGRSVSTNVNTPSGKTDFSTSLDHLVAELPGTKSVSLVVAWFGDDLRCNSCTIRPKVEQTDRDGEPIAWRSGGIPRSVAMTVPQVEGRAIYGGTPADGAVIEAIRAIRGEGLEVMFYPFILMEQLEGNTLPDPWSGAIGQPALPWRGRITTSLAPGLEGTPDRTALAEDQVQGFFGTAGPDDFSVVDASVVYTGPDEWSYRRFILHYARLCALAGGVDAFCIGSEMRSLTQIRGAGDTFPAVDQLKALAADVREILGPGCKLSYAADWSEYASYSADGSLYFHLDPLWSDPNIDFIGIDNYLPVSDWRDVSGHADEAWGSIYSQRYLQANIEGGEYYDWYYDSPEAEVAQRRSPIVDDVYDEPWVYRTKDFRNWWQNPHHNRIGGVRNASPTGWVPMSKPFRFAEIGCAAIDKGTNQPNRFLDLRSSESALPRASTGRRDDLIQLQYLKAVSGYWSDDDHNPVSPVYGERMIDMEHAHVWAWDARPFPAFPARGDLWGDSAAYVRGHWLNGRTGNQSLASVVTEICQSSGVPEIDVTGLDGLVRGYAVDQVQSGRSSLQPLLLAYAADAAERDGMLCLFNRTGMPKLTLDPSMLAVTDTTNGYLEITRSGEPETGSVVRLAYIDAQGDFDVRAAEARFPDEAQRFVSSSELALGLTAGEARSTVHRWLAEARIGRETARFVLPPSRRDARAGDTVALSGALWRIDRVEAGEATTVEATRVERGAYVESEFDEEIVPARSFASPGPVYPIFLDLPLLTGAEAPHAPHVAVAAEPWPGAVGVWSSPSSDGFELNRILAAPAIIGVTETVLPRARPGLWDRGDSLRVRVVGGGLSSASLPNVLNGANILAIGDGSASQWEVLQFARAELVAEDTYDISMRLRGQLGTDGIVPPVWPIGSTVVILDRSLQQTDLAPSARGLVRTYRIGVFARGVDNPAAVERQDAFDGIGLRPYPVCHLRVSGAAGLDVEARWTRRTRVDGDNWSQSEVPLGEDAEVYLVRVLSGEVILAEYETHSATFAYPASAQIADGVAGAFSLAVAQVSTRFGPGPFRSVAIPA